LWGNAQLARLNPIESWLKTKNYWFSISSSCYEKDPAKENLRAVIYVEKKPSINSVSERARNSKKKNILIYSKSTEKNSVKNSDSF
jgi:hypothetical protein